MPPSQHHADDQEPSVRWLEAGEVELECVTGLVMQG
jgi:hypothetical protein